MKRREKNFFIRLMLRYGYIALCEIILLGILNMAIVRGNEVISTVIDSMLAGETIYFQSFFQKFLIITIIGFAVAFAASVIASKYSVLVTTKYRQQVIEKLYHLEYRYFDEHNSASIINKANSDLGEAERFLNESFVIILTDVIAVIVYADYVRRLNPGLFLAVLLCYPLVFWIANKLVQKIGRLAKTYRAKADGITGIAQDVLNGILVVKSFGLQDYFQNKMHAATIDLVENEERRTKISNTAIVIRQLIQWLPNILCAVYSVVLVIQGNLSIGELLSFIIVLGKLVDSFVGLPFCFVDAAGSWVCIQRVEEILHTQEEEFGEEVSVKSEDIILSFTNVTFGYGKEQTVLDDISFTVTKGENIAFVGESGGGKSTIFHLLCGFYSIQKGSYYLYGRNFKDWNIESAREHFALVSQNVFLFPTTIAENVRYGNPKATQQEVIEACKAAEIHDFIMTLPEQYQTVVGERGAMLSGGQKQRISIARAMLKNAPVLLLDEPTSAIDEATEKDIQAAIAKVSEGKTCLTIAHRLSTIQNADRIFVVEKGKIREAGTYEEYMAAIL